MDKKTADQGKIRPTKKQQGILDFIGNFIAEHGYSPSYREIMKGLNYSSIATIALHIDSLIARGHLQKRDNAARSLEVLDSNSVSKPATKVSESQEAWLVTHVLQRFEHAETTLTKKAVEELYVLVGALKVLGLEDAARSLIPRLTELKAKANT